MREALQRLHCALQEHRHFDPAQLQQVFRLGLRDIFEAMLLPGLTAELATRSPGVSLSCIKTSRTSLAHDLATGRIDLAADVLISHDDNLCHQKLLDDPLVCLLRQGHPQAHAMTLETYLQLRHVLVSSRERGPAFEDVELSRHGLQRHVGLRTPHYYAAALVAGQTDMLLTVPQRFACILQRSAALQICPLPLPIAPMEVYLYWHRHLDPDPAHRWLRTRIQARVSATSDQSASP